MPFGYFYLLQLIDFYTFIFFIMLENIVSNDFM